MLTSDHPECLEDEVFLGNFTPEQARNISWTTKRYGIRAYCVDGSDFPYQHHHGVLPYFVKRSELAAAGVLATMAPTEAITSRMSASKLDELLRRYETLRKDNPRTRFVLACPQSGRWLVLVYEVPEPTQPDYRIIICGQGESPEAAVETALKQTCEKAS